MNWLTNFVRPKIRALVNRETEIPDNLWIKCDKCGAMIFHRELETSLHVCSHCGNHMRIGTAKRLALILDEGFTRIEMPKPIIDPLKFRDRERYTDRLKRAHAKSAEPDALSAVAGTIGGIPSVVSVLDFDFMGGSMGIGVGNGFVMAAQEAVARKAAFIAVTASGGARMQEGILSLMQMPRTTIAVQMVKEAGLPYIVVLTDPTTGGVSASFAMLGDIQIAESGAYIAFAGARVIENTVREKLPEGFQRAEYLLDHGMLDLVVPRSELQSALARILHLLMQQNPNAIPIAA